MEISDVQRVETKEVVLTVRTTKQNAEWMRKNNISPSLLFDKAILELQQKMAEDGLKLLATPKQAKMGFKSDYFKLNKDNFTEQDIKSAIKDLDKFKKKFEEKLVAK